MEHRGSKFRMIVTFSVIQMLSISAVAQGPAPAPEASPNPPSPATPSDPAPIPAKRFVTDTSFVLTVGNDSFTGRQIQHALTSPSGEYTLALVMDGFGTETESHYCWTEIHNSLGNLTFRENCDPIPIPKCTLSLTGKGDLRLTLESNGAKLVSWRSDTEDDGVVEAKLDDAGVLTLVKADDTVVWTSADDKKRCLKPYRPGNGSSGSFGFVSKLVIIGCAILSIAISS